MDAPPIDLPLFGLDSPPVRPHWLENPIGDPAIAVGLGHGDYRELARGHPWVLVTSWLPSGESWSPTHGRPERELAWRGLSQLLNTVTPYLEAADDRRQFGRNFRPYLDARTNRHASWATARWRIDSTETQARFARFAGGWTGFAYARDTYAITIVAVGISPHDVGLSTIALPDEYHPESESDDPETVERNMSRRLHSDVRKLLDLKP